MLKPKLDVLPSRQPLLWDRLASTPRDFVLYGGTALAQGRASRSRRPDSATGFAGIERLARHRQRHRQRMTANARLREIARRVNWYADVLLADVDLFLAQVMARGRTEDIVEVERRYSREALRQAYLHAPPGLFTRRAWAYWGLVLLGDPSRPLPERFPGANRLDWRKKAP